MKPLLLLFLLTLAPAFALEDCAEQDTSQSKLGRAIAGSADTVFPTLDEAIKAQTEFKKPVKTIKTSLSSIPEFPSYSSCKLSFFRVATINKNVDGIITQEGWKSGWARRKDELKKAGAAIEDSQFDGKPPSVPIEDRIIEYVRVKNVRSNFPKHSTIVGVLEDPIRTLSVGYHTGYDSSFDGNHMRMDEIEVGSCAKAPECQKLVAHDSTKVFSDRGLTPRYSTEGEWAIDTQIPAKCIVATYRITFQKVDDKCYSDANGNCNFKK